MSGDISPISRTGAADQFRPTVQPQREVPGSASGSRRSDRAEFSEASRLLSKLQNVPDVRQEIVDRVKSEIDAGQYITDEKIDSILGPLADDLDLT